MQITLITGIMSVECAVTGWLAYVRCCNVLSLQVHSIDDGKGAGKHWHGPVQALA